MLNVTHKMYTAKLLLFGCLVFLSSACGQKKLSDRDLRREKIRAAAHLKRQELQQVSGTYRGQLLEGQEKRQDVVLSLDVKDVPDTSEGEVDPVLVPTLSGSFRLTFGTGQSGEFFNFTIKKADFDSKGNRLSMVVSHDKWKDLLLELSKEESILQGTWTASETMQTGSVEFHSVDDLKLGGETKELRGDYPGLLLWDRQALAQRATLHIVSVVGDGASPVLSATLTLHSARNAKEELLQIVFEQAEFNPFTNQISLRGEKSDISIVATFRNGVLDGSWISKQLGRVGQASFHHQNQPSIPPERKEVTPVGQNYFGTVENASNSFKLPKLFALNLNSYVDPEQPASLGLSGALRFYYGDFSSSEFIDLPLKHVEYHHVTRRLVLKTETLTLDCLIGEGTLQGRIAEEGAGQLATFAASITPPPAGQTATLSGNFNGFVSWDSINAFQDASLLLTVKSSGKDSLKLEANLKLFVSGGSSNDEIIQHFEDVELQTATGLLTLRSQDSEMSVKGYLRDNEFHGEWSTKLLGRMGEIHASKILKLMPSSEAAQLPKIAGTYRGLLKSTSDQVNLPERLAIGLVTTREDSGHGNIRATGSVRFYFGPFDSQEYNEYPCEEIRLDFFSRRLVCRLPQEQKLTFTAVLTSDAIKGEIQHDNLGKIAQFEVTRI